MRRLRFSLKQYLAFVAAVAVLAWFAASYESWYGVRWTQADSRRLAADLAAHKGTITAGLATRVALEAAAGRNNSSRRLPSGVRRDVWTFDSYDDEDTHLGSTEVE